MLLATACARHQVTPLPIERLDLAMADSLPASAPQQAARDAWFEVIGLNDDDRATWYRKSCAAFAPEIESSITSLDSVEAVLGQALQKFQVKPVGVVNPFNQAVITHPKGYVFIGLNHYLGANSPAYAGFPEYVRKRKELKQLPADVVEAVIASRHEPKYSDRTTLLNTLLYRGALLNSVLKQLPEGTPEATILGMTDEEYDWCRDNEARIWQTLIERDLLYSTSADVIARLMKPSPHSTLINANAPGQTLLYTALKIAQAYEKSTGTDAAAEPYFYNNNQTLIKSKYAPANASR